MENKYFFKSKKTLLASSIAAAILGLTACGGDSGGDSASAPTNVQMSGAVVDDFVAFAKIYVDVNDNNQFDSSFEPYAYTDEDGYFSISKSGKNYCNLPQSEFEYKYCLKVNESAKNGGIIRVETGRDLLTTQVYNATMSLLANGEVSDLSISSISTIAEQVQKISGEDLQGTGKTKDQVDQEIREYLNVFLGGGANPASLSAKNSSNGVNPNKINPFNASVGKKERAFKLAVQFHKMAEAYANAFVKSNSGTNVKDFIPFAYRAMIINMDFSVTTEDLFDDLSTKTNAIVARIASLSNKNAPTGTNLTGLNNLNRYLNCVLSDETDSTFGSLETPVGESCRNLLDVTTQSGKRNRLFAGELATKENTNANVLTNSVKIVSNTSGWNYQNRDFEITIDQAAASGFAPNSAAVAKPFDIVFDNKNILLGTASDSTQFRFYFTKKTNEGEPEGGTFVACQKDGTGASAKYNIINGRYKRDGNRDFIAYMQVLALTYTFKNIEANVNIDQCQATDNSCLGVSYIDISGGSPETKNNYFGNQSTLDTLFKETNQQPTTANECRLAIQNG